ncbi:hypothetical protein CM15mP35_01170 [bacterium]|nr:MAG: hypothetical protein CM15mP35_01170 [bacterium]
MNIGFVGLGKLGLPCALAIDSVKNIKFEVMILIKMLKKYLKEKQFLTERKELLNFAVT